MVRRAPDRDHPSQQRAQGVILGRVVRVRVMPASAAIGSTSSSLMGALASRRSSASKINSSLRFLGALDCGGPRTSDGSDQCLHSPPPFTRTGGHTTSN